MFEIFVRFGQCVCCLLPRFVNRQVPCLHTNSPNVLLFPLMHQCKRARSGGVSYVRVSREEPGRKGKKPRTTIGTIPPPPPIRRRNPNNSAGLFFGEMLPSHQDYGPGPPNTLSLWLLCCQRHVETLIS